MPNFGKTRHMGMESRVVPNTHFSVNLEATGFPGKSRQCSLKVELYLTVWFFLIPSHKIMIKLTHFFSVEKLLINAYV